MNIIAGKTRMETHDAVQAIATFYAGYEKSQRKAVRDARKLREAFQAIHDNGDAGAMATMSAFANLDALVTSQHAETLRLHLEHTNAAQERGIDTGPLAPDGDGGDIGIMSGGDR